MRISQVTGQPWTEINYGGT